MATYQKRGKKWRAIVRKAGYAPVTKTFTRKTDAKNWAQTIEIQIENNEFVPSARKKRLTVSQLIDWYIDEILPDKRHNKDQANLKQRLEVWRELCGKEWAAFLSKTRIESLDREYIAIRKTRSGKFISGATRNRYLAALSAVYSKAVKDELLNDNPVTRVERKAESEDLGKFLGPEEAQRVLAVCRGYRDNNKRSAGNRNAYAYMALALTSGLRRGDIEPLTWDRVDLKQKQIAVPTGKHDLPRMLPIVEPALAALEELQSESDGQGYVFKGHKKNDHFSASHLWARIRKDAKLNPKFRLHDLRHTVGTHLNMTGATDIQIAHQLGHKTLAMAKRYSKQTAEFSRGNAERMAGSLFGEKE